MLRKVNQSPIKGKALTIERMSSPTQSDNNNNDNLDNIEV